MSYANKISTLSLIVALATLIISLTVPEIRVLLGLGKNNILYAQKAFQSFDNQMINDNCLCRNINSSVDNNMEEYKTFMWTGVFDKKYFLQIYISKTSNNSVKYNLFKLESLPVGDTVQWVRRKILDKIEFLSYNPDLKEGIFKIDEEVLSFSVINKGRNINIFGAEGLLKATLTCRNTSDGEDFFIENKETIIEELYAPKVEF